MIGSNSYTNSHEVNFFLKFARYLFNQGYHQHQITLLVTYREELLELQKVKLFIIIIKILALKNILFASCNNFGFLNPH